MGNSTSYQLIYALTDCQIGGQLSRIDASRLLNFSHSLFPILLSVHFSENKINYSDLVLGQLLSVCEIDTARVLCSKLLGK